MVVASMGNVVPNGAIAIAPPTFGFPTDTFDTFVAISVFPFSIVCYFKNRLITVFLSIGIGEGVI